MKPSLSALRKLHIEILTNDIIPFLLLAPNVTELRIEDITRPFTFPASWSAILPRLESFDGPSRLIPHLVHQRPVTSLSSWHCDWINTVNFYEMGPNFGSSVPVRKVRWSHSFHLSTFLDYMWKHNPTVEELSFEGTVHHLTKERISPYLAKIKRLKYLRILQCPGLLETRDNSNLILPRSRGSFERDLSWELEQCRSIRESGCLALRTVSFTENVTWNFCEDGGKGSWRPVRLDDIILD